MPASLTLLVAVGGHRGQTFPVGGHRGQTFHRGGRGPLPPLEPPLHVNKTAFQSSGEFSYAHVTFYVPVTLTLTR